MPLILVPKILSAQPQYPAKLTTEFLQYNPRILVQPNSGTNTVNDSVLASTSNVIRTSEAYSYLGTVGTSCYTDMGSEALFDAALPCSVVVIANLASFTSAFPILCAFKSVIGDNLELLYSNSGSYVDFCVGTAGLGANSYSLTAFGSVTGTWHVIVITYDGSSSYSGFKVFCNGALIAASSAGLGVSGATGNSILGMRSGDTSLPFPGRVKLAAYYKARFPDSVAMKVSANPWIEFEAPDDQIPVGYGAPPAGGVTYVKVGGSWLPVATSYIKNGGVWKPTGRFVNVAGVWKPV